MTQFLWWFAGWALGCVAALALSSVMHLTGLAAFGVGFSLSLGGGLLGEYVGYRL
jgi:hypothetical protein